VLGLWDELSMSWGPPREVREQQPLLAIDGPPRIYPDPLVRRVRSSELDAYLPAAIAMFIEEVGVDPRLGDGGASYRSRVAELISSGRAFARFDGGQVVFKAEIGALSSHVGQIQGVWVHPALRGRGLGTSGTAAVVEWLAAMGRVSSLYVNAFNHSARSAYERVGFTQVGSFSTILF
jgi:uncharacterized protein